MTPGDNGSEVGIVRSALDRARRDLLDLTFRNKFLNYRILKARGAVVTADDAERVAKLVIDSSAAVTFVDREEAREMREAWLKKRERGHNAQRDARRALGTHEDEPQDEEPEQTDDSRVDGDAPSDLVHVTGSELRQGLPDRVLIADHDESGLDRRLANTAKLARTMIEERGVNTLFLALGVLRWTPAEQSQTVRESPLLLVPAALERADAPHGYRLRHDGEDVQGNPTLAERLKQENIEFPLPGDGEELHAYFDRVEIAIRHHDDWTVDRAHVSLGFFSFTRYLMYLDLDVDRWPDPQAVLGHPVVGAALGGGFASEPPLVEPGVRLDGEKPYEELHHVLEADGSQSVAVAEAMARRALVVQGPPGTGKSQTITNLLAEAVVRGERVLFVAEKKAALDVVARRLADVGLSPAALELHSDKATRSAVIQELRRTVGLGAPERGEGEKVSRSRDRARVTLNAYVDALHEPLEPHGATPFELMAALAQTEDVEHLDLASIGVHDAAKWTRERLSEAQEAAVEAGEWIDEHGDPAVHPFRGVEHTSVTPMLERQVVNAAHGLRSALVEARDTLGDEAFVGVQNELTDEASARDVLTGLRKVVGALRALPALRVEADELWSDPAAVRQAVRSLAGVRDDHEWLARQLLASAWSSTPVQRLEELREDLSRRRDIFYRWFDGRYRRAARTVRGWAKDEVRLDARDLINVMEVLTRYQAALAALESDRALLGQLLPGVDVLDRIDELETPLGTLANACVDGPAWLNRERASALAHAEPQRVDAALEAAETAFAEMMRARKRVEEALSLNTEQRFPNTAIEHVPFQAWHKAVDEWIEDPKALPTWIRWRRLRDRMERAGVGRLHGAIAAERLPTDHVPERLSRAVHLAWLQGAFEERDALSTFDASEHESELERFRDADASMIRQNRVRVVEAHADALPAPAGHGQMGTLLQEFHKKRRHLPIRRLMERAGSAVQAIKPIFMMSPLSAAVYLPPGRISFDLVVFDEASQVRPSDALGALLRGERTVVVGDDKQLPPTSFFDLLMDDDEREDDDEFVEQDVESVLGLFGARGAPSTMLEWHYRSQHESLIAVSNQEFYDNRLLLFPSPDGDRDDAGIQFVHLPDAVYDRGKSRTNRDEARAVAAAVLEHVRTRPDRTLGVAALSKAQADAIYAEVDRLRREHNELDAFDARHPSEPLFVKNLETVQGDERDVIFVSIGYGRDANGKFHYSFGPLNNVGGERRLNVLVTRARSATRVFANFSDEDMDPAKCRSFGLQALRTYLAYARTGRLEAPEIGERDDESPFEDEVAAELTRRGYLVHRQVGQAGYSIDLAIADADRPGRFVIGIECDGATYHSSRSARDRDRLRQGVLEGLGWTLHRIWSTDWFLDREACIERATNAIDAALEDAPTSTTAPRNDVARASASAHPDAPTRPEPEAPDEDAIPRRKAERSWEGVDVTGVPYRLARTRAVDLQGREFHEASPAFVAKLLAIVVEEEAPVHVEDAYRRVLDWAGIARMGKRIRAAVQAGEREAMRQGVFRRAHDALVPPSFDLAGVVARDRSGLDARHRDFARVPRVELDAAIRTVVRDGFGVEDEEIPSTVARLLGFGRATSAVQQAVRARVEALETRGDLARNGAYYVLAERKGS